MTMLGLKKLSDRHIHIGLTITILNLDMLVPLEMMKLNCCNASVEISKFVYRVVV